MARGSRPYLIGFFLLLAVSATALIPTYGFWMSGGLLVILTWIAALFYPRWLILPIALGLIAGQLARIGLSSDSSGGLLLIDVAAAAYGVTGLIHLFIYKKSLRLSAPAILMGAFGIWATATLILGLPVLSRGDALQSIFYLIRFGILFLAFAVTPLLFNTEKDHQKLTSTILIASGFLVILGFLQLVIFPNFAFMAKFGWDPHEGRLLSTFFDPNFFGMFLTFFITILVARMLTTKTNAMLWLAAGLSLVALILTFSRSSYLALAISLLIVLGIKSWRIMIIVMIVGALAIMQVPRVRTRVLGAFQIDTTAQDRIASWKEALTIIQDHPLTGVGYNAFGPADIRYGFKKDLLGHSARGTDSSILFVTATTGFIGLLLYGLFLLSLCWQAITIYRLSSSPYFKSLGLAFIGIWPALFVHSQFVNSLFYPLIIVPVLLVSSGLTLAFHSLYKTQSDR